MATAHRIDYATLDDEWDPDVSSGIYTSKLIEGRERQRLIFNRPFRDGIVSAEIMIRESKVSMEGGEPKDSGVIFRYKDPNNF